MQNYKKLLLAAAATLVFSANALAVDKYKVGIEGAYPPFNNKNASGEVVGFDPDIAMALCAKMKAECEIVTSDWDGIIPAPGPDGRQSSRRCNPPAAAPSV